VSVLTKKRAASGTGGLRDYATNAAQQLGPMAQQAAQQAVPLARSAGASMRQGADGAIAWATPFVEAGRSWAAPQLEQSARAITDSLAPMISSALISTARKIDVKPKKSRGRVGLMFAIMALTAAAGMATLAVLRRRSESGWFASVTPASDSADLGSIPADGQTSAEGDGQAAGRGKEGAPGASGDPRIV